jgi:hypothetical protein
MFCPADALARLMTPVRDIFSIPIIDTPDFAGRAAP